MQQISDLTRSWSDVLSTLSIGSLAVVIPDIGEVHPSGDITLELGAIDELFLFAGDASTIGSLVIGLIGVSLLLTIGSVIVQMGEFMAMLPEASEKGSRGRARVERSAANPLLVSMFSNSYTSYRLLCGIGALLMLVGISLLGNGLFNFTWQPIAAGAFCLFWGALFVFGISRFAFLTLDWVLFGGPRE